jgi:hypothetical protein
MGGRSGTSAGFGKRVSIRPIIAQVEFPTEIKEQALARRILGYEARSQGSEKGGNKKQQEQFGFHKWEV